MFNSTWHWQPIVNGYSGFFPPTFYDLARQTRNFPDEHSIDYLKSRGVDLIVVHAGLMDRDAVGAMTAALLARLVQHAQRDALLCGEYTMHPSKCHARLVTRSHCRRSKTLARR